MSGRRALLIVSQDFDPDVGGTQTYAWELASRLARTYRVIVVAPQRPGAVERPLPFEIRRVPGGLNGFAFGAVPELARLLSLPEVVGALAVQWTAAAALRIGRAVSRSRIPVGLAAHGRELLFSPFSEGGAPDHAYGALRGWALEGADLVFAVSRYTAGLAGEAGVPDARIRVIPNGVDVERFQPGRKMVARKRLQVEEDQQLILCVCRLVPRKGVDVLLEALAQLDRPDLLLWVAGDGPDRLALQDLALRLGLEQQVRFLGRVESAELPDLFAATDVFAMVPRHLPPDVEGFGLVYLEASACGVATLGSTAGGISDAVLHEETGLLVPPGDVGATALALARLLDEPGLAEKLGARGRKHAEETATWDRVADTILAELLGG